MLTILLTEASANHTCRWYWSASQAESWFHRGLLFSVAASDTGQHYAFATTVGLKEFTFASRQSGYINEFRINTKTDST